MDPLRASWSRAWHAVGGPENEPLYERLVAAYSEPGRHYHTLQHLGECIAHLAPARTLAEQPPEVELALWFHDAVHDTRRADNEALSAAWARQVAHEANAPTDVAERLHDLVMATRHVGVPSSPDQQLLVDVDLAILGAPPDRFDQYERQVREEYAWVPEADFGPRRRALLAGFLARPVIYRTGHFHALLEARARANLARSMAGPES